MNNVDEIRTLRESIRLLERNLGILNDAQAPCCGVSFAQCHALVEIGRLQTVSLNQLANLLGLDKSTMSKTINNLVINGMVVREIDPEDRRYITIKLTEQGMELFQAIETDREEYFSKVYNKVPESKRKQVIESLNLLIKAIADV